jgi:hypothetical protein
MPRILLAALRARTFMRFNQARPGIAEAQLPRRERSATFIL